MSIKTKILSLFLLLLLVTPVFFNSTSKGSVLGATDDRTSNLNKPQTEGNGEIAGGVMDNKNLKNAIKKSNVKIKGWALVDKKLKTPVYNSKFSVASEIQVKYKNEKINLIVSDTEEKMAKNVLFVLDERTYKMLGADPSKESKIEVEVNQN